MYVVLDKIYDNLILFDLCDMEQDVSGKLVLLATSAIRKRITGEELKLNDIKARVNDGVEILVKTLQQHSASGASRQLGQRRPLISFRRISRSTVGHRCAWSMPA